MDPAIGTISAGRREITSDGIYRIASISKVLTALALAETVRRGEATLDAPAERGITLRHLATHTSGIPTAAWVDGAQTVEDVLVGAAGVALEAAPGEHWAYSNLGATVLGHRTAALAGTDYETLVRERVTEPLGMPDTVLDLSADQADRWRTSPAPTPTLPLYAPSGGYYSTVTDLLTLLDAHLNATPGSAYDLVQQQVTGYRDGPAAMGLGWIVDPLPDSGATVFWHNGSLPGYRSYLGFVPTAGVAVAVLTNTENPVTDLGIEVLDRLVRADS
jgi:D-alanyl-D-alanine-carboxypeptidase/D-alanyl-D-alanine-endopeptidase